MFPPPPPEVRAWESVSSDPLGRHVVLPGDDQADYTSLRRRGMSRADRYEMGRDLRQKVPRSALGEWAAPPGRRDVVEQVVESLDGRVERLIPIRVGRMVASPYGFLRGSAGLMAEDLAGLPATGIQPVICGDAHLGNFGFYASPERHLVLDLNDFDEAHPGPWEWDLRRLVTAVWVAGRQNGLAEDDCAEAASGSAREYRRQLAELADRPLLARSFERVDVDRLRASSSNPSMQREIQRAARRARNRTSDRALPRFTEQRGGRRRIVEEPPLITELDEKEVDQLGVALDGYLATLPPHWRRVLGSYSLVDAALKVVGVGSVGLRAYVALCEGSSPDDVLFLQLKQARRSVVARHVHGDSAWHAHQGQRVVEYQQDLQTVSDPLLGWTTMAGHQFYVRQFRDMKGSIAIDTLGKEALHDYAGICGALLAKGHARTGGASLIAGYIGSSQHVDRAMVRFARKYADQVECDYQALVDAVKRGMLPVERGV